MEYVKESRERESIATSFEDLSAIALVDLEKQGLSCFVCGPITTGGRGSADQNVRALNLAIEHLIRAGENVFTQLPYEPTLWTLKDQYEMVNGRKHYCMDMLVKFYLPLFQSGLIIRAYFLPGWETSTGAKWEREQFERLGIHIVDLSEELINELMEAA